MTVHFNKYQGTGNDFILIDDREKQFPADRLDIVQFLCDRKFGIGADGLMLIQDHESLDFRMIFYNPDGSKSLCGNGSRCAVAFAHHLGMIGEQTVFETTDGEHSASLQGEEVHFQLRDVGEAAVLGKEWFINTGSPHHVVLVDEVEEVNILKEGAQIRYSETYQPSGTNVNFMEPVDEGIKVRTYERGVENETLSCGTGVTACALAASFINYDSPVRVETKGGILKVSFDKSEVGFTNIYLSGPAKKVYEGTIDIAL